MLHKKLQFKHVKVLVTIMTALWLAFVIGGTVCRYLLNWSSTFDFGIFSQMYYYMKETFLPLTTCERDGLLSHFAVHMSPAYYLFLPIYWLFPSPITLFVIQAGVIAAGVVPCYLIAKDKGLSPLAVLCFCGIYCTYPALIGGAFYDFHENAMLTLFILWSLYFMQKKRFPLMYLFLIFTAMVKEDAPVYVAGIGLFLFFHEKEYKHGIISFVGAVLYFLCVFAWMKNHGNGVMIGRYDNIMPDEELGLISIFKVILVDPAYLIQEMFNMKEKVVFFFQMMVPLLFLPFMTGKIWRYILLIPFVLWNMLPDYQYQHSIYFQYIFGSSAMLFYLSILNYGDRKAFFEKRKEGWMRRIPTAGILCAAAAALAVNLGTVSQKGSYVRRYFNEREEVSQVNAVLDGIPREASVQASTFYVPRISMRDVVYRIDGDELVQFDTDYAVIDLRKGVEEEPLEQIKAFEEAGYRQAEYIEGWIAVLEKE